MDLAFLNAVMAPAAYPLTQPATWPLLSIERFAISRARARVIALAVVTSLAFGGPTHAWLYVTQGGKVFRRETKRAGVVAWEPVKPPQPGL